MSNCRCDRDRERRRVSRRATLRATAGLATSALIVAGVAQKQTAAQEETLAATSEATPAP